MPIRLAGSVTPLDASSLWSDVKFPVAPSKGRSIAQEGPVIVEAGLKDGSLVVANSSDSGATWTTNQMQLPYQIPSVDVALSGDGKHWIVGPPHEGSMGAASTYTKAYVATAGGALQAITMPGPAGHAAWAGSTLLVSGGANGSHLWASTDNGQSFADASAKVLGSTPPNANSDAPTIGALLQLADGVAVVEMTKNGNGSTAAVHTTHDGTLFTKTGSANLTEPPAALDGLTSTYGSDAVIMASTRRLIRVASSGEAQTITMQGLPEGLTSVVVQFRNTTNGIANVTASSCTADKAGCTDQRSNYTTSDGGQTWAQSSSH
ncbi:hypothetical protein [Sinomonas albida]|uniref:hypothetical protein n=1 Tax=Sinomonas albida TaxID=369942 RepID=UPI003018FCA6